jgi:soluble lytic murein transglycosylase
VRSIWGNGATLAIIPIMSMKRRLTLLLCLHLLAALACNAPAMPGVQVVTATPSETPTSIPATPTAIPPTFTPTIPPTPTPTIVPKTGVESASLSLRNGDYASAVKVYRSVLDQPTLGVDPMLRASASFGAGVAALREGLFTDAVTLLSEFIQTYPNDQRAAQAYFLRGDAYLGTSQWQPAIDDFTAYMQKRPGLLDSYAWERIGDAHLALQQPQQALTSYGKAAQGMPRSIVPLLQLREKVALAYLNAGDVNAAVDQYDEILKVAKNTPYRASIAFAAAQMLDKSGSSIQALSRYKAILAEYPTQPESYRAMVALINGGTAVDEFTRGRVAHAAGDWNMAIEALYNYSGSTSPDQIAPDVFMMLGRSYREAGNVAASLTSYQTVIDQYPTSALVGDAWLEQGRTLFLANRIPEAVAKYKELGTKNLPQSADGLSRAAYLLTQSEDWNAAFAAYDEIGKLYPNSELGMDAIFKAGMIAWNQGKREQASQLFAILANRGTGTFKAAGAFWLGRIYQLENDPDQARAAYEESAKADPYGYYSQRSRDLLSGHGPLEPPASYDWTYDNAAKRAEADAWMRQTFSIKEQGDLWQLSTSLQSDPRKLRADELWTVAAFEQARAEYAGLRDDMAGSALALYQLASYFHDIGLHREAISTAELLINVAKVSPAQAPRYLAALAYPIAYADLVLPTTKKYEVDPLLVFSLMRQESLFESFAQSYAAAQGLMQIIPDTGRYIADKLKWPAYQNSDLFRPYINVEFGVFYLKEQLDTFKGNKYAALAAYNAGPGASAAWMKSSGGDPDLFVQAIEYNETQTYVRKIYEQYQVYAAIYGAK